MTLLAIKHHMRQVKMTSLANLCEFFKIDADTLRGMLSHWIRKGMIRKCFRTKACGSSCFKCPVLATEIYEWTDSAAIIN